MHTNDFSKAPTQAQGAAIFFGGTHYGGILVLLRLIFVWRRVSRRMKASPGYRWHTVWYQFPFTIGTISVWDSREDLMRFAQSEEHTDAVEWLLRPGMAKGAFIRFYDARPEGHTIRGWRAEEGPNQAQRQPAARSPGSKA